jgi:hypothetical protein
MAGLSFVTLVSYDVQLLPEVIGSYYAIADEILLGLDKDRIAWSGRPFALDLPALKARLAAQDPGAKIRWVEEDFHSAGGPMECDTAERNHLSTLCKPGNWVMQIDADEVLLNASELKAWMDAQPAAPMRVIAYWITVYKRLPDALLVVDDPTFQVMQVGGWERGAYFAPRLTREPDRMAPLKLLHYSYGRSEAELEQKLGNWGHAREVDVDAFLRRWRSVDAANYAQQRDLHPVWGPTWPRLRLLPLSPPEALLAAALALDSPRRVPTRFDRGLRKLKVGLQKALGLRA